MKSLKVGNREPKRMSYRACGRLKWLSSAPKEKLEKIGQPCFFLGFELLIFRLGQTKRASY